MKIKKFEELEEFDVIYGSNNYEIVLKKEKDFALTATYLARKDLIDLESLKCIVANDEMRFNVAYKTVEKLVDKHYVINGEDVKIKK